MSNLMSVQWAIAALATASLAAGCAGSPLGNRVQESLAADPQLEESDPFAPAEKPGPPPKSPGDEKVGASDAPTSQQDLATQDSATPQLSNSRTPPPNETDGLIGPELPGSASGTLTKGEAGGDEVENWDEAVSLAGVPEDFQAYIRDLQRLNVLTLRPTTGSFPSDRPPVATSPFMQPITRREYARWLFASYNRIAVEAAGDRLRPGNGTDQLAFKDVPATDPDFAAIQGLAAAGIIPSAWTGKSTDVNFRPDTPLSREDLILWKVPLDTRAALPKTTPEAVAEAWGFQDAASIDPLALRAIAADYQLGDFANIRRAFGYTTLFRPDQTVSRAEAAAVLWRFGDQTNGRTAADLRRPTPVPNRQLED